MMSQKQWEMATEVIHGMDLIARSFNDEDWVELWLIYGVPDGDKTLEKIRNTYPWDEDFDGWFNELSKLFCKLIAKQAFAGVVDMDGKKVNGIMPRWKADGIVYVGQDLNAEV